jgi:hypothetical protein
MRRLLVITAVAAVVIAGCASDSTTSGDGELPIDAGSTVPGDASSTPIDPGDGIGDGSMTPGLPVVDPQLAGPVDLAVADLEARLGTGAVIEVVVAHELTWPDGSLGCPEPGVSYTQALVDGYRIELSDGTTTYEYHGAVGEDPFFCEAGIRSGDRQGTDSDSEGPGSLEDLAAMAVRDLSEALGVSADDIEVTIAEAVVWRDGSFGCPQPGYSYTQALTSGARFALIVSGETYWYHQGGAGAPQRCEDPQEPYRGDAAP